MKNKTHTAMIVSSKNKPNWMPACAGMTDFFFWPLHKNYRHYYAGRSLISILISNKSGFTLVELSIVLVIIGLIIGGVLTGQQIMQNARITSTVNGIQAFQAQFQTYTQNFGSLPGDDPNATSRFPTGSNIVNGNNNGQIGTATSYNTTSTTGEAAESYNIWEHLRAADLIKNQTAAGQPTNPFNGIYGFQAGAFNGAITTTVLCLDEVSGVAAQTIDTKLDDGASDTGTVRGATMGNVNATPATSYSTNNNYVLCVRM